MSRKRRPRQGARLLRTLPVAALLGICGCGDTSAGDDPRLDSAVLDTASPDRDPGGTDGQGGSDGGEDALGPRCPGDPSVPDPPPCDNTGIVVAAPYDNQYKCYDLGAVPGVPVSKYGGVTLLPGSCTTLLIGGTANYPEGMLYAIEVKRNGLGQISGFVGSARVYAEAAYNDGGIVFGPDGVLFLARWPENDLGQHRPGSSITDKVIDLDPLGVPYSLAGLNFVPSWLPNAGTLKLVSWPSGQFYTATLSPDGSGLYDVTSVTAVLTLQGGPEGFTYVSAGNPLFPVHSMLVSEWTAGRIAVYEVDQEGNPDTATRRELVRGLKGAEGAYREPSTGDFFFSTWQSYAPDHVIVVRGFDPIDIE